MDCAICNVGVNFGKILRILFSFNFLYRSLLS